MRTIALLLLLSGCTVTNMAMNRETGYWKEKGYSDLHDLNSHVANPNSQHHTEALALIQWSHEQWELAVANIDVQSNIQEIINSLQVYE